MKRIPFLAVVIAVVLIASHAAAVAGEMKPIELPAPQTDGGKPLMQALKARHTERAFSSEELPLQVLSNMLWAAFGVNRPESGKRTAPSAMNWQEIDIYVATARGLFRYDAAGNKLDPVLEEDIREATGAQPFVAGAPVNLVYVADYSKMGDAPEDVKKFYSAAHTGFISQNVYLFCASEGLATVVRGSVDREELEKIMKLGPEQKVVLAQTVGYPAE
jgi:SagB-type dehydrogenase family enzyme